MPSHSPDDARRQTKAVQNGQLHNYGATSDQTEEAQSQAHPSPSTGASSHHPSASRCSPAPVAVSSVRELLGAILTLTGPISLTTVVESMVGHSPPATALRLSGHPPPSEHEGALLETYGLATLVYSTAAFSIVYGFICGLDSVAAVSVGLVIDAAPAEPGGVGDGEASTASATVGGGSISGSSSRGSSPRPLVVASMRPMSSRSQAIPTAAASLRNQHAVRAAQWASPPLRGVGSPAITAIGTRRSSSRRAGGAAARGDSKAMSTHSLPSDGLATSGLHRSPSAPLICDSLDIPSAADGGSSHPHHHHSHPHHPVAVLHSGSFPPPDLSGGMLGPSGVHGNAVGVLGGLLGKGRWIEEQEAGDDAEVTMEADDAERDGEARALLPRSAPMAQLELGAGASVPPPTSAEQGRRTVVRRLSPASPCPSASPSPSPPSANLIGAWIARCLLLEVFVVTALILFLHFGTEPLLVALGEPAESIPIASAYVQAASFGLPFVAIYHSFNKGLQSSGVVLPVLLISIVVKALCLAAVWAALYVLALNLVAVAWIMSASMLVQALAVYAYMCHTGIAQQWWGKPNNTTLTSPFTATSSASATSTDASGDGGSSNGSSSSSSKSSRIFSWHGLWDFCKLAFPACMAICLEFWLFDLLGALAGLLPDPATELATHYLLFTTTLASYMIFSGLSVSVSVLVGQKLGFAGHSENARRSAIVGTSACMCVSVMLMLLITLFHSSIARALTAQPTLLARFSDCMPVLVAYQAVDGLNTCSTQLLRTLGVQSYGVLLHFTTYYAIGMACAWTLAFPLAMGVKGLWIGLRVGVGLNSSIATVWLWRFADWESESAAAQTRANNLSCAGDTPAAYLSSSDDFVGARESLLCPTPLHADERTSFFTLKEGNAHTDHHGH